MSTTSSQTIKVVLPELGESVTEGIVVEWRVAEGDTVESGQTLLDVTTDKVDVEVPAPASGVVARIVAAPGDTVEVGALLAELTSGDGAGNGSGDGPAAPAEAAPGDGDGAAAPAADEAPGPVVPIVLPDMESVTEGVVVEWRVAVGDVVAVDQIVVEVSTDKVDLEVPSPAAGRIASIAVPAGETFTVGHPARRDRVRRRPRGRLGPRARRPGRRGSRAGLRRLDGRRRPRVAQDQPRGAPPGAREGRRPLGHHGQRPRRHHPQVRHPRRPARAATAPRRPPPRRAPPARRP